MGNRAAGSTYHVRDSHRELPGNFKEKVEDGEPFLSSAEELKGALIVLAASAGNPASRDAAGRGCLLLRDYLERITGIKVPTIEEAGVRKVESPGGGSHFVGPDGRVVKRLIWVGDTATARRMGIKADDLAPGGYRIATTPEGMILIGNDAGDSGT